jgi:hypothetical protein
MATLSPGMIISNNVTFVNVTKFKNSKTIHEGIEKERKIIPSKLIWMSPMQTHLIFAHYILHFHNPTIHLLNHHLKIIYAKN